MVYVLITPHIVRRKLQLYDLRTHVLATSKDGGCEKKANSREF